MKRTYIVPKTNISAQIGSSIIATSGYTEPDTGRSNDLGDGVKDDISGNSSFSGGSGGRGQGGTGNRVKGFYSAFSDEEW